MSAFHTLFRMRRIALWRAVYDVEKTASVGGSLDETTARLRGAADQLLEAADHTVEFTHSWYAARFEGIKTWARKYGTERPVSGGYVEPSGNPLEIFNILANGSSGAFVRDSPPQREMLYNLQTHELREARERIRKLEVEVATLRSDKT